MASQSASDPALVAFYASIFQNNCCAFSVTALVVYDGVVTLSREVPLFWTGKARPLSAVLYFSNKYLNVLTTILDILGYLPMSDNSCTRVDIAQVIARCSSFIPPAIFTALRAYALTRRHWLSALVFLLSSVQIVPNLMDLGFHVSGIYSPISGCFENIPGVSASLARVFVTVDRVSTILADTILIAITWKLLPEGTWFVDYNARRDTAKLKGLASIMLRNGITYFIVLSILNTLPLIFIELSIPSAGGFSHILAFTYPLSCVLVSHFLLDLQEAHHRTVVGLATDDPLHTSRSVSSRSIAFANALGSLGAMIGPADYGREEDLVDGEDADVHVAATECIPPTEGEPTHELRIEDEFVITEVPRGGDGEVAEVGV